MPFKVMRFVGTSGMVAIGAIAGAAAGVSVATNLGITDLGNVGIAAVIGGVLGLIGGVSVGIGTLWSRDATREAADSGQKQLLARLGIAQFAWTFIVIGISLPYLAVTLLTVLHLSQIGTVKLDTGILSHAAGLLGAILWIDGVVLQLLTVIPTLRVLMRLAITVL